MDTSKLLAAALQENITADLRARGHSNADIDDLPVTVEMWRRIARVVDCSSGRLVQTLLAGEPLATGVERLASVMRPNKAGKSVARLVEIDALVSLGLRPTS